MWLPEENYSYGTNINEQININNEIIEYHRLLSHWDLLYPPNAYTMPWIRTDKIYTLIDHVLLLLLPTSYIST